MTDIGKHKVLNILISIIWVANGLLCKVLNLVPRHQQIVGSLLGEKHARAITVLIGLAEVGLGIWVFMKKSERLVAILQIILIALMNTVEFILVPELLLWGKYNSVFALLLIVTIYYNEYCLIKRSQTN
jgi:hypothetical protein